MIDQARALVEKQVRRVGRRLLFQVVVQSLVVTWAVGLLVTMVWFLVRPFTFAGFGETVRWSVPGAILGASTLAGLVLAWLRRPNLVVSSLALDEKFGLKERVTTLLTLPAEQLQIPAGQALVRDVTEQLATLQVTSEFPLRISWKDLLMPAGAFALAMLACVFDPMLSSIKFGSTISAEPVKRNVDTAKIQDELDKLKKNVSERSQEQALKSEELKELEKEFEKLLKDPLDARNEEKVRERINEMRKLEDKMKERAEGLKEKAEKIDALKKQLEKLGLDKDKSANDGPAKDFEDALMNGQLDKAKGALEKMVKDLKNDKLTPKQQKELGEQLKKLQEKLNKLVDNDEFLKQRKKEFKEGKISKEELDKAMNQFKDLQELADIVGDCEECLGRLDGKEGADKLDKLMKRFEDIELTDAEIRDLLRDQAEIDDAMRILMSAMEGDGEGDDGDGLGGGGRPGRRRPIDPNDPDSKILNERQRADVNPKGVQRVTGYARGGNFKKIPATAVEGAFRQAVQEAPEALDRQRIPDDAADVARRYFNKLGNQK